MHVRAIASSSLWPDRSTFLAGESPVGSAPRGRSAMGCHGSKPGCIAPRAGIYQSELPADIDQAAIKAGDVSSIPSACARSSMLAPSPRRPLIGAFGLDTGASPCFLIDAELRASCPARRSDLVKSSARV